VFPDGFVHMALALKAVALKAILDSQQFLLAQHWFLQ